MRTQVNSKEIPVWISNSQNDLNFYGFQTYNFPLYLYPEKDTESGLFKTPNSRLQRGGTEGGGVLPQSTPTQNPSPATTGTPQGENSDAARPNFNPEIIKQIEAELGMELDWQAEIGISYVETKVDEFAPTDLLDYIYAVLHSPSYRDKYKEFLKIDFPRIPFGKEFIGPISDDRKLNERFWLMVKTGVQLRKLHLMEGINPLELSMAEISGEGENTVEKVKFEKEQSPLNGEGFDRIPNGLDFWDTPGSVYMGKVWINDKKYFDNVPEIAWHFYIGGYQPAQKWLKDRKGRELSFDEIMHYQKMIYILSETARLMKGIDNVRPN